MLIAGLVWGAQSGPYRTLNDQLQPRDPGSLESWRLRAAYLKEHVLASAGLLPLPERTPLRALVFGSRNGPCPRFKIEGPCVESRRLSVAEIVRLARN